MFGFTGLGFELPPADDDSNCGAPVYEKNNRSMDSTVASFGALDDAVFRNGWSSNSGLPCLSLGSERIRFLRVLYWGPVICQTPNQFMPDTIAASQTEPN